MINAHVQRNAAATIAAIPVPKKEASDFGVLEIDPNGRIIAFHEKVKNPPTMPGSTDMCLASMGNYIFRKEDLIRELNRDAAVETSKHDFGHDILPRMVSDGQDVYVYDFAKNIVPGEEERAHGYWRDVGTIEAYWEAQMDLIAIHPLFNLYNDRWPIRTGVTHDPPAKFVFRDEAHARVGIATDSMVSHGCIISGGRIHRSVLSVGCRVNSFAEIEESILYERVRVGRHAKLRRCIIDKDVEVPPGVEVGFNLRGGPEALLRDRERPRRHPEAREARRREDVAALATRRRWYRRSAASGACPEKSRRGESVRTVIVGDVHGCASELDALLDAVAFTSGDRLVFVGDLDHARPRLARRPRHRADDRRPRRPRQSRTEGPRLARGARSVAPR